MKSQIWHGDFNQYGERLQFIGDITVNLDFWDCECTNNYIHPIIQDSCQICNFHQKDCPSSRADEVQNLKQSQAT